MTVTDEQRARLKAHIAKQDAERGRPLTDREKVGNLYAALSEHDDDCLIHKGDECDCGADSFAEKFKNWKS